MKKILLMFITLAFSIILSAQDLLDMAFDKSLGYDIKSKREWYKGQILKKERSGMGILKMKDGRLYIGDFSKSEISGFGMMIMQEGSNISNCSDCTIYVGNWRQGKKSGKGKCYDISGDVIYSGKFEKDLPVETYPSNEEFLLNYFSLIEYDDGNKYLGEINNGQFDGYGVFIQNDGDLWFGNVKDGEKKGIGLYLMRNGEWVTLNFNGDNYETISSSVNYKNIDAYRKSANGQTFSLIMNSVASATLAVAEVSNSIQTMQSDNSSYSNSVSPNNVNSDSDSGDASKNTKASSNKSKIPDCGYNWRMDSYSYSRFDTELIKMRTSPENYSNYTSDFVDIQSKMRQIRLKWEARGCKITKSQFE